jgi:hypothetical protein
LNKIFILFNKVWTSKCPLSIGHFIESRHTVDQRHVRCASRSKDQSLRSSVSRLNCQERSQIKAAEFFFADIPTF